jgi:hypothetical protein
MQRWVPGGGRAGGERLPLQSSQRRMMERGVLLDLYREPCTWLHCFHGLKPGCQEFPRGRVRIEARPASCAPSHLSCAIGSLLLPPSNRVAPHRCTSETAVPSHQTWDAEANMQRRVPGGGRAGAERLPLQSSRAPSEG